MEETRITSIRPSWCAIAMRPPPLLKHACDTSVEVDRESASALMDDMIEARDVGVAKETLTCTDPFEDRAIYPLENLRERQNTCRQRSRYRAFRTNTSQPPLPVRRSKPHHKAFPPCSSGDGLRENDCFRSGL